MTDANFREIVIAVIVLVPIVGLYAIKLIKVLKDKNQDSDFF
jgi:hypothetical protein